jgi:ribosome assembly protein YihI (activator of Der GTPase)
MVLHGSILRDEIKELENEMSVAELIEHITSDKTLTDINTALEDIALDRIIDRTQDAEEIIKRGKI